MRRMHAQKESLDVGFDIRILQVWPMRVEAEAGAEQERASG